MKRNKSDFQIQRPITTQHKKGMDSVSNLKPKESYKFILENKKD